MQELWEYIEANYNEENFNIMDAKAKSLELEKKQIIDAIEEDIFHTSNKTAEEYYKETYDKTNG